MSAAGVVVASVAAAAADCSFSLLAVAADSSIDSAAVGGCKVNGSEVERANDSDLSVSGSLGDRSLHTDQVLGN